VADHILVIDDELSMRELLGILLKRDGFRVTSCGTAEEGLEVVGAGGVDLVLTDLNLPGVDGLEFMRRLREQRDSDIRDVPVVLITAYGTAAHAVEAMKQGAADYVLKPFNNDDLLINIRRTLDRRALREENVQLRAALRQKYWFENLIGASPTMLEVYHLIQRVKDSPINCLLHGESGTGKELVARAIHYSGSRKSGPFIAVNCGAIPDTLIESELFGYKKGAFTGATRDKKGYFEAANGGTLFLDEVGDMPLHAQVAVLRALAQRTVSPVGGVEEVDVDVRIVAASHRDLAVQVAEGSFRDDLYYRLNVVRIDLPPLRDREGDIELLSHHFVRQFADEYRKPISGISSEGMAQLRRFGWPGNIRELRNAMERAVALEQGKTISLESLPETVREAKGGGASDPSGKEREIPFEGVELDNILGDVERRYLELALQRTAGNRTQAAELLGMSYRSFRYRLEKFGLDDED
jgi:two-component system response regulator PilR (NtrC family)